MLHLCVSHSDSFRDVQGHWRRPMEFGPETFGLMDEQVRTFELDFSNMKWPNLGLTCADRFERLFR